MPTVSAVLGPYSNTTGIFMTPSTPIVGGDGSVDDRDDATYVAIRAQQINDFIGAQQSSFSWNPGPVDLPDYNSVTQQSVTYRIRHSLVMQDAVYPPIQLFTFWSQGPLADYIGHSTFAELDVIQDSFGGVVLPETRWREFQDGTVTVGADLHLITEFFNPLDFESMPPGTEARIHVYEYEVIFAWSPLTVTAPRRKHPREDGLGVGNRRIYPPPISRQRSKRRAGGYT